MTINFKINIQITPDWEIWDDFEEGEWETRAIFDTEKEAFDFALSFGDDDDALEEQNIFGFDIIKCTTDDNGTTTEKLIAHSNGSFTEESIAFWKAPTPWNN